jgi:hypothetical protein
MSIAVPNIALWEPTPLLRWQRDIEQVRQSPPFTDLRRLFFHRLDRLVRRDSTFLLNKLLYEAPPHLAGHTVEVRFDPLDTAQVEIWFQGKLEATARPVDPVVNSQLPSVKSATTSPEPEPSSFFCLSSSTKLMPVTQLASHS